MLVNYYDLGQLTLQRVKTLNERKGYKQRLVIHGCCAPCSCYPLEALEPYFDITILYTNSNIYPQKEYEIRLNELIHYVERFNLEHQSNVKIEIPTYDNASYTIKIKNRANDKECGPTCHLCYELRLRDAFEYAREHGFEYAGTVMTISRQKNSTVLNEIGLKLEKEYPSVQFIVADFKKKGGQIRRDELSKDMYRQQYCGCVFSYQEYLERVKQKEE